MVVDPWDLLRSGQTEEAFQQMQAALESKGTPPYIMELGVAYLWVHDYQAAWEHFNAANQRKPRHSAAYYGMAGAAKWCLDKPEAAVREWQEGLRCQYADAAGGARMPLLLFFASAVTPNLIARTDAEKLLLIRANDRRVRYWPGPVVEVMLGRIDEDQLRKHCAGVNDADTANRHWLSDFYLGVVALSRGDAAHFNEAVRKTADLTWTDFDRNRQSFLGRMWHEEFFIARHQVSEAMTA